MSQDVKPFAGTVFEAIHGKNPRAAGLRKDQALGYALKETFKFYKSIDFADPGTESSMDLLAHLARCLATEFKEIDRLYTKHS